MANDSGEQMQFDKPRLTPIVPYGAIMQAIIFIVGLSIAGAVVVYEMRGQQTAMLERMDAMQRQFQSSLTAQVDLMESRVDLLRAELEGQIKANEARISSQERLLSADIARIRQMLEELTKRLERDDQIGRQRR